MTQYGITHYKGKPTFTQEGKPVILSSYCGCGTPWRKQWLAAHMRFAENGCKIFWLMPTGGYNGEWGTTPFWTAPGEIHSSPTVLPENYFGIDEQAQALLEIVPDARFFVRMNDFPPKSWSVVYPDEMQLNDQGKRYTTASLASQIYLQELNAYLRALLRFCESSEWAERIIGYINYPLGEGHTQLAGQGFLFDQSPVMQREFRKFLKKKYRTDTKLRKAWCDMSVSLECAQVPSDSDFRQRHQTVLFWPNAQQVQRERDYFELQTQLFRHYWRTTLSTLRKSGGPNRLYGIDAFKGNLIGWMPHPIMVAQEWKTHYGNLFLATGTTGMADILDWPEIDVIATPHDYRNRWIGFGYDPEGIGDSLYLRNKMMMVEEDQRSYANNEHSLFGSIERGEEDAILYRNLAASLSKGQHTYPMDVCVGYFESDKIQQVLAQRRSIEEQFLHRARKDVPSVVMLVDDRSGYYTDFTAEYDDLAVIRQRIHGMNHCGVPTRTFLFDDLRRDDFPACHKMFLLPNCYKFDETILELLRAKLFCNGNVIVFGPGSGITDGRTVAPDFAQQLMGLDFELFDHEYPRFVTIDNFTHPLTQGLRACETFGDTHRYGPVLVPLDITAPVCTNTPPARAATKTLDDGGFVQLGSIALDFGKRRPGLVVKEFGRGASGNGTPGKRGKGDYAIVFSAAVPLPAVLLRNLARYSGTHIYNEEDDVVYADSSMVALHAVKPGRRTLRLPGRFDVWDVIAQKHLRAQTDSVTFMVKTPVTKWFRLS